MSSKDPTVLSEDFVLIVSTLTHLQTLCCCEVMC